MNKKIVILMGFLMLMFAPIVGASDVVLDTLEYEETKLIAITGNVTLPVSTSPDISLLFRLYDSASNITIYNVKSNEIIYDSSFVNDTKNFSFLGNDNNTYIIRIDYSSIQVPPSFEEIIAGYEALIDELEVNNTRLLGDIKSLQNSLNESLSEITRLKEETQPLLDRVANLTAEIELYEQKYWELKSQRDHFEGKYKEYKDSWNVFPEEGFYFNWPSAIITAMMLFIIFNFFSSRSQGKPTIFEGIKTIIFKQKPKIHYREPSGSELDQGVLKKIKDSEQKSKEG